MKTTEIPSFPTLRSTIEWLQEEAGMMELAWYSALAMGDHAGAEEVFAEEMFFRTLGNRLAALELQLMGVDSAAAAAA